MSPAPWQRALDDAWQDAGKARPAKRSKPKHKPKAKPKKRKKGSTYDQRLARWKAKPYDLQVRYDVKKYRAVFGDKVMALAGLFSTRAKAAAAGKQVKALKLPTVKVKIVKLPKPKKPVPPRARGRR